MTSRPPIAVLVLVVVLAAAAALGGGWKWGGKAPVSFTTKTPTARATNGN